jgi:hypothetical protein
MKQTIALVLAAAVIGGAAAKAEPIDLSAYADANGYIDIQKLTCAQLANTYQEDANLLAAWYSGWYNGLGHKHYMDWKNIRQGEHRVIERCKSHPEETIIQAIDVMIKEMRRENGIRVED